MSTTVKSDNKEITIKNKALAEAKIESLIEDNGRKKIKTRSELKEYSPGALISYVTKDKLFHPGGFLVKIKKEYFIVFQLKNKQEIRVDFDNVKSMYVGNIDEVTNDIVGFCSSKSKKTNYPVKFGDHVVYYAQSRFDIRRFSKTDRFKNIKLWFTMFGDETDIINI